MNKLDKIDEFKNVLAAYKLSEESMQQLAATRLVLLVGPSSSGRNTIISELVKTDRYHYVISDTTRKPRVNDGVPEEHGREYWFRSEDEVLQDLREGKFLEAAIIHNQQVSGISMRELSAAVEEHRIPINEIEIVGAETIHRLKPDALFFFVIPPSFDEWMARMNARGQLHEGELARRVKSAVNELEVALQRDYFIFIVNNTFVHSAREIDNVVNGGDLDLALQRQNRQIAELLLQETRSRLQD